jgi:hypothetical protein
MNLSQRLSPEKIKKNEKEGRAGLFYCLYQTMGVIGNLTMPGLFLLRIQKSLKTSAPSQLIRHLQILKPLCF